MCSLVIGLKQIKYFSSNVLDKQPNPTILVKVDEDEDASEDKHRDDNKKVAQGMKAKRSRTYMCIHASCSAVLG